MRTSSDSEPVPTDQFHRNSTPPALSILLNDSLISLPAQGNFALRYICISLSDDSDLQPQGSIMEKKKRSILPCNQCNQPGCKRTLLKYRCFSFAFFFFRDRKPSCPYKLLDCATNFKGCTPEQLAPWTHLSPLISC